MLDKIIDYKKEEIKTLQLPEQVNTTHYSLKEALTKSNRKMGLISEVKKASPSKGIFVENFNPLTIAKAYELAKADAISCLTDEYFFQGKRDYLSEIKQTVSIPVLRKDFIIDPIQVNESARMGADAILLIAQALDHEVLKGLYQQANDLGLECLVEVHTVEEAYQILNSFEPDIIGINNRNLKTFETNLDVTKQVKQLIPGHIVTVSESGIKSYEDISYLEKLSIDAVLVGEALMKAETPKHGIQTLFKEASRI